MTRRRAVVDEVVSRLAAGESVVLRGPAGIGKTHLARAVAARLPGRAVRSLAGGPAQQAIGFGALLHLLDPTAAPITAEFELVQRLRAALVDPHRPTLLVVDDVAVLDEQSAGLIESVVRAGDASLLATERVEPGGRAVDHTLSAVLGSSATVVEVPPMTDDDLVALLDDWIGPGEEGAVRRLCATSRGNPMVLRHLVEAARAGGALRERAGLWYLEGFTASGQSLERLVGAHLARLGAAEWDLVRTLAIAGSLPRSVVRRLDLDALEQLERGDLVDGDPTALSHPLYTEVVRASMSPEQVRRVCAKLVASIGPDDDVDPARLGRWLLDAEQAVDDAIARRGAAVALGRWENDLARRLLEHLAEPTVADRVQLVWAHANAGDLDGAVLAADDAVAHAAVDADRVAAELARAELWCLQLDRRPDAYAALDRLRAGLADAELIARVDAAAALYGRMTGNDALATAAVESATSVSQAAPVSDEAQLAVLVADAFTQVFAGRFVRAADPVAQARALAERLGQRHNRVRVDVADTLRAIHLGDLAGAHALVDDALHLADVAGVRPAHVVWLGLAAQLAQIEGRLDRAQRRLREAVRAADHVDDFAAGGFVRGDLNALRVELGVDESLDESGSPIGQARARIRLAEPADADALAAELAAATADAGYLVWAPWIAREAVRRGPAPRSTALLESWAAEVDGPVVARFARHGRAVLDGDVAVLDALADESDATGFVLPGVEVLLDALELDPVPGDPVARRRRVLDLLARAAGVGPTVPPQLAARIESVVDAAEMPSGRQLEVARLVAAGRTSKEVAAELVVSVRTVDNHLAAVYRKLGVSSRHELADLPLPGR